MFEQADGLAVDKLCNHVTEHGTNSEEALIGMANILQASLVEEDLLNNEDRDCLGEFGSSLHDAQAKGDDFRREQEMNDRVIVILLVQSQSCPIA